VEVIEKHFNGTVAGKHFALWGLAFKPNTDDIREAPALTLIEALLEKGATITAFDPEAVGHVKQTLGDTIGYAANQYAALENADALIIATEWSVFRTPDFEEIEKKLPAKLIFDGRNLFELEAMKALGFTYYSIGRATV
jgi:UDPglucose 6-dehydrogenase